MNGTNAAQGAAQGAAGALRQGTPPGGMGGGQLLGGPTAMYVLLGLLVVTLVVLAIAFWKISSKAGFSPFLGLLMLVPVVNLGAALYIAFAAWPALAEVGRLKAIAASMGQWGRPADAPPSEEGAPATAV
jgi:hypothetical protein